MKNILIVEDSHSARSMIRAAVEEFDDIVTVEAATGFEALKQIPTHDFHLIITDINMPDISGLELIHFVKNDPRYKNIPLLIVSTERTGEDQRRGLDIGADDYITKPFTPEALRDKIKNLLEL
jgi:two-component system chemotaxis response regulator CheY